MKTYTYTAYDPAGTEVSGELEAESSLRVYEMLNDRGFIPDQVKKKGDATSGESWFENINRHLTPVKARDLILFTKQFKTMIQAGIAMIQILEIMIKQTENKKLKAALVSMLSDIKEGASLSATFKKQKHVFSDLYCAMIEAGESSGSLPSVLDRLIYIIEHEYKVKSDIKAAVRYPAIVVVMLVGVFFFLLTFIVPKFVSILERVGMDLPLPTKVCIFLYSMIHNYWAPGLAVMAVASIVLYQYLKTEPGQFYRDRLLMQIPLIGPLFVKSAMSRFASIFSILQSSGVTVLDSMDILAHTIANAAITREFIRIKELLTEGRGISNPLSRAKYFTPMVVNMTAIGEESGNLDEMLQEVAQHYDTEVEYATKSLSDAIAPILTVALAAVVGFVALAIFLPMWNLTNMVN
jgi:type II secretory pathway component PulF